MNREQINKKIVQQRAGYDAYMKDAPEELATIDRAFYEALCNMALNSIPKAFDPENPPKEGWWLVLAEKKMPVTAHWSEEKGWYCAFDKPKEADYISHITHYMPIPEVGESK